MAIGIYDLEQHSHDVIHETSVDFIKPIINTPIHLMQYDNSLPIIAVKLYKDNIPFILPDSENVFMLIRWGLKDHSFIHKQVLGCNVDRDTVYFMVSETMLTHYGSLNPILELIIQESYTDSDGIVYNKRVAGSSYIRIEIDKNPIQRSDIEAAYELHKFFDIDYEISINPTVTGQEPSLVSIGFGDDKFILPNGTPVIPNPTGEVIDDRLEAAKIGNSTYGVFTADKKNGNTISPIVGLVFEDITNNQEN